MEEADPVVAMVELLIRVEALVVRTLLVVYTAAEEVDPHLFFLAKAAMVVKVQSE
jgi:hypothetical protein